MLPKLLAIGQSLSAWDLSKQPIGTLWRVALWPLAAPMLQSAGIAMFAESSHPAGNEAVPDAVGSPPAGSSSVAPVAPAAALPVPPAPPAAPVPPIPAAAAVE